MSKLVLHTQKGCVPCRYLEKMIKDNSLGDMIEFAPDSYHPLVNKRPTLIIDNASALVGVIAIEKYFKTHLIKE